MSTEKLVRLSTGSDDKALLSACLDLDVKISAYLSDVLVEYTTDTLQEMKKRHIEPMYANADWLDEITAQYFNPAVFTGYIEISERDGQAIYSTGFVEYVGLISFKDGAKEIKGYNGFTYVLIDNVKITTDNLFVSEQSRKKVISEAAKLQAAIAKTPTELITREQFAELLKISVKSLQRLENEPPDFFPKPIKTKPSVSGHVRFYRHEVEAYIVSLGKE